jgi:hypothetical protein
MLTLICKKIYVNMRIFPDFFLNMQFFSEHACLKKKYMFENKSHVDIKNCMLSCNFLHVDMQKIA